MPAVSPPTTWPPSLALADGEGTTQGAAPERIHDLKHDSSVLAIAVNDEHIFSGTHEGEILVWSLDNFQLIHRIQAHKRSVLCLFLSSPPAPPSSTSSLSTSPPSKSSPLLPAASLPDGIPEQLLVSSAGDATISVWCPRTMQRLFEIYSTNDMGDIFSVVYSSQHQTVYIGAQDTTIQWVHLNDASRVVAQDSTQHPDKRYHRFFDSKAVGGTSTPRRNELRWSLIPKAQTVLEVDPAAIQPFAHYGYVYCMVIARGPTHNLGADEEVLLSGGGDGTIKMWRIHPFSSDGGGALENGKGGRTGHGSEDNLARASRDRLSFETVSSKDSDGFDGGITEVMTLGTDDGMSVLSIAVDGSFLYCGRLDGVIELWDLDTRQRLRHFKAHNSDVMTIQMCWGYLWSASANGFCSKHSTVHYTGSDATSDTVNQRYQCLSRWKAHNGKILASAATTLSKSKGRLYITGANDEVVSIWRIRKDEQHASATDEAEAVEDVMLGNLRDFVSYKTVSSRPEFSEDCRRGATFLCTLFKRLGGEVQMLLANDQVHNPVVYAKFSGKQPADTAGVAKGKGGSGNGNGNGNGSDTTSNRRKRILFYGHYDVVPADTRKDNTWATDPFSLKGVNGYLYGRGVSDNKGPIMAALYAVSDLMQEKQLESDVVFLIEGEEEAGSRGFQEAVRQHQALIGPVDYILLANSYWLDDETPCLTYGLRGVLHATVCVDSSHPDLHSGVDGSYMMAEPLSDLTGVLSKLKGQRNRVMIPHFYDAVLPLRPEEAARFDAITCMLLQRQQKEDKLGGRADSAATTSATAIVAAGVGEAEQQKQRQLLRNNLMSRWREPNLTIHRYKVSGPDGSLVSSHACANISLRLVPGQEVDDVIASLKKFLEDEFAKLESSNQLSIKIDNKAEPWLGDPDSYLFRTLEEAVVQAWHMDDDGQDEESGSAGTGARTGAITDQNGSAASTATPSTSMPSKKPRRPLYIREGGSIPAVRFLEKQFGAPAAHLPCGQSSDSAHLPNERLRVLNLHKSREIFKHVFKKLHA